MSVRTPTLSSVFNDVRAGYWGAEAGMGQTDVKVIRNGDISVGGSIRWDRLPSRGFTREEAARSKVTAGDLVMTTSGDCGQVAIVDHEPLVPTCVSNFLRVLRVDETLVDPKYLFHYMNRRAFVAQLRPFIRGSTLQNLSVNAALSAVSVAVPPIEEQRRIGELLARADALRVKRHEAIDHLDALTQSIFLDMFGRANRDWTLTTVGEVVDSDRGGIRTGPFGSQLLHSEFTKEGVAVLGIDNVVSNTFRWEQRRFVSYSKYEQLKRYTVHPDDLLITIMGTCGRVAIVPGDIPVAINTKHLCCITLQRQRCHPEYLHSYFRWHPMALEYLSRSAKGAIMSGLNMGIIRSLPLRLPPLEMQEIYSNRVCAIKEAKRGGLSQFQELGALVGSLQQRVFAEEV